jgi:hypothetical protein
MPASGREPRFRKFAVSRRSKAVGGRRRAAMRRQPPQAVTGHLQPFLRQDIHVGNGRSKVEQPLFTVARAASDLQSSSHSHPPCPALSILGNDRGFARGLLTRAFSQSPPQGAAARP